MLNELTNEITHLMDEHVSEKWQCKNEDFKFHVYIYSKKNDKGDLEPTIFDVTDKLYGMYLRYPGYTCGNIIINKEYKTIHSIVLTRRGGAFSGEDETVFNDPDKLEKILNDRYRGKRITDIPFDGLRF